jgi:alginate O-acetyltransferase complex protein AlgI
MNNIYIIIVCIIACTPLVKWLANKLADRAKKSNIAYMRVYNVLNAVLPMALLALSTLSLIGDSYNPFIYYRF